MRWLLPLGLFAIASIAGFWLALDAIPGVIMGKAMDRIGALGSEAGDVRHAPRLREDNQTIVRASPDILYSVCVYEICSVCIYEIFSCVPLGDLLCVRV